MLTKVILYQRPENTRDALIMAAHLDMIIEAGVDTTAVSEESHAIQVGISSLVAHLAKADPDTAALPEMLANAVEVAGAHSECS